jgi:hypothetical protein
MFSERRKISLARAPQKAASVRASQQAAAVDASRKAAAILRGERWRAVQASRSAPTGRDLLHPPPA